jgi:uncharacterized protein involved in exopolysaccharide biosynthesis
MSVKRYLATFFRGRRLYIPALLLMLAATALGTYFAAFTQYEATARIWVDRPALDNVLDPNAQSFLASPAQEQADKLTQLIQTDSFMTAVLTKTTMAGRLTGGADQERVIKDVRGKLAVTPIGSNTVRITYTGSDAVLCQQMVQSTIDSFRDRDLTARVEQSAIEQQFYEKQLQIYEGQVNAVTKRLEDFQTQHPYPDPTSPQYLELQGLQRELESARALLNATRTKVEQASAANSLSDTSRRTEFQILDAPTVPTRPAASLTRLATYLGLGLILSFGLIIAAVAFATWQDTTIRDGDDLQRLTRVPLLDSIPHLPFNSSGGEQRAQLEGAAPSQSGTRTPPAARVRQGPAGQMEEPGAVYSQRVVD